MKEDLADWFNQLYQLSITVDDFFEQLETGVVLCRHANSAQEFISECRLSREKGNERNRRLSDNGDTRDRREVNKDISRLSDNGDTTRDRREAQKDINRLSDNGDTTRDRREVKKDFKEQFRDGDANRKETKQSVQSSDKPSRRTSTSPESVVSNSDSNRNVSPSGQSLPANDSVHSANASPVQFRLKVQSGTFQARDNVSNFIAWCRRGIGIPDTLLFETEDLVVRKNERNVVLCLLEVARRGARWGMLAPQLIQFEVEIDAEINAAAAAASESNVEGEVEKVRVSRLRAPQAVQKCVRQTIEEPEVERNTGSPGPLPGPSPVARRRPVIEVDMMSLDEMVCTIFNIKLK